MPEWTRRLTRELDTFAEQNATTTLPVPIALNQPPEPLRLGPSDDAEWAAFAAEAVLRAGEGAALGDLSRERRMRASIDLSWNAIASEVAAAAERAPEVESALLPLRARISVRAGLGNLATGLRPPATGHDNPHYFDDAACVRACVLAVAHPGDPRLAAELAEFDARYTQDGDGVHGARAMAAAVSLALAGADVDACVNAALAELPASTEIGRNTRHALRLARESEGTFALVPLLEHQIVDHVYSYGIAAAETVPVALALATAAQGRIAEAVPAAACLSRVADSAPALAGALTGALGGGATIPAAWRDACRTLSGCALPASPVRISSDSPTSWKPRNWPPQRDDSGMTPKGEGTGSTLDERITGALVGAAVGDALGGPVEGYSPSRSPNVTAAAYTASSAPGTATAGVRPAPSPRTTRATGTSPTTP